MNPSTRWLFIITLLWFAVWGGIHLYCLGLSLHGIEGGQQVHVAVVNNRYTVEYSNNYHIHYKVHMCVPRDIAVLMPNTNLCQEIKLTKDSYDEVRVGDAVLFYKDKHKQMRRLGKL